jgi:hypothetical protein
VFDERADRDRGGRGARNRPRGVLTDRKVQDVFRRLLPDGDVWVPGEPAPAILSPVDSTNRRLALWGGVDYARDLAPSRRRLPVEVTAWCPDGTIRMLFLADRSRHARSRARWRDFLRQANLSAASDGVLTGLGMLESSARDRAPAALAALAATSARRE